MVKELYYNNETAKELFDKAKMIVGCGAPFVGAVVAEFLAETGSELIEWKAEWAESTGAMAIAMLVAAVVVVVVLVVMKKKADDFKVQKIK